MRRLTALFLAAVVMGAAHADENAARYTKREGDKLMFCTGLVDNAVKIADRKLAGHSAADVKREYQAAKFQVERDRDMLVSMVDKVYADQPRDSLDYGLQFVDECITNLAQVPKERAGPARGCLRDQVAAIFAWNYRESRRPAAEAVARLARLGGGRKSVIDAAYVADAPRGNWILGRYKSCIAPHLAAQ